MQMTIKTQKEGAVIISSQQPSKKRKLNEISGNQAG